MQIDIRHSTHPEDVKRYNTNELRKRFLVENVFRPDLAVFTYTHADRMLFGGIMPTDSKIALEVGKELGTEFFLERRELGLICIEGAGSVNADGTAHAMKKGDGLYIGMGTKDVVFSSAESTKPAKFYAVSTPAHHSYPTVLIPKSSANPRTLGGPETVNVRTIYQYVHPAVCESCQLSMGMTMLAEGSVWNTMPCHTHDRRMETYLYFDMDADTRVFHFHGEPTETRHMVVANEQAIISPSWSIHSGVGTGRYTFIWAMAGENQNFDDMDFVQAAELR